jgi:hypothetical protein
MKGSSMKQSAVKSSAKPRTGSKEETFTFGPSASYANCDEYASKGLLFDILAIAFEPGRGYEGRDRWAVTVKAQDRDPEVLTLGSNPKRDAKLREAQAYLERSDTIKNVRLRRSGNAYYFTGDK